MAGYNTTMNVLATGVRAMMMPFTGNGDREQWLRLQELDRLGIVNAIDPEELVPEVFADVIEACLKTVPTPAAFDLDGASNTAACLRQLVELEKSAMVA